jgi:hypothetical protein
MTELTLLEVLQIAGGLPDRASLDELSYREGVPAIVQGQPATSAIPASPSQEN